MSSAITQVQVGELWLQINPYGGAYLGPQQLAGIEVESFSKWCNAHIDSLNYPLCWLELDEALMPLIPAALAVGFNFHHCQTRQLMMVKKLKADAYLPFAATHSIGIGGATFNARGEILLIREKPLASQTTPTLWKLPGGMVEPFENFTDAVIREVFEETGISATFSSMLAVRHHHHGQFNASNLYFVALLQATAEQITIDEREIAEARWFEPQAYLQHPQAGAYNKILVQLAWAAFQQGQLQQASFAATTGTIATNEMSASKERFPSNFLGWHSHKIPGYRAAEDTYEVFSPWVFP